MSQQIQYSSFYQFLPFLCCCRPFPLKKKSRSLDHGLFCELFQRVVILCDKLTVLLRWRRMGESILGKLSSCSQKEHMVVNDNPSLSHILTCWPSETGAVQLRFKLYSVFSWLSDTDLETRQKPKLFQNMTAAVSTFRHIYCPQGIVVSSTVELKLDFPAADATSF